jgi:hypothetical protein
MGGPPPPFSPHTLPLHTRARPCQDTRCGRPCARHPVSGERVGQGRAGGVCVRVSV